MCRTELWQKTQRTDCPLKWYRTQDKSVVETNTENKIHHDKKKWKKGRKYTTRRKKTEKFKNKENWLTSLEEGQEEG